MHTLRDTRLPFMETLHCQMVITFFKPTLVISALQPSICPEKDFCILKKKSSKSVYSVPIFEVQILQHTSYAKNCKREKWNKHKTFRKNLEMNCCFSIAVMDIVFIFRRWGVWIYQRLGWWKSLFILILINNTIHLQMRIDCLRFVR